MATPLLVRKSETSFDKNDIDLSLWTYSGIPVKEKRSFRQRITVAKVISLQCSGSQPVVRVPLVVREGLLGGTRAHSYFRIFVFSVRCEQISAANRRVSGRKAVATVALRNL